MLQKKNDLVYLHKAIKVLLISKINHRATRRTIIIIIIMQVFYREKLLILIKNIFI